MVDLLMRPVGPWRFMRPEDIGRGFSLCLYFLVSGAFLMYDYGHLWSSLPSMIPPLSGVHVGLLVLLPKP